MSFWAATVPAAALGGVLIHAFMQTRPRATNSAMQGGGDVEISDMAAPWSFRAQERVSTTFQVLGLSLMGTAAVGVLVYRSGAAYMLVNSSYPWVVPIGLTIVSVSCMLGSRLRQNTLQKRMLYAGFVSTLGLSLSPLGVLGAPLLLQAAVLTGVTLLPLCAVGALSPSTRYLYLAGPLSMGLGLLATLGCMSYFFPDAQGVRNLYLYGGLSVFGVYTLYDAGRMVHRAQTMEQFDPIDESTALYLDMVNFFVKIVRILAANDNRRHKKKGRQE